MGIYIYGAGRVGRSLEGLLSEKGYSVDAFVDVNAENLHYKEYIIMKPESLNLSEKDEIIVALAMENAAYSAKRSLEEQGYKNVVLWFDKEIQDKLCVFERGGGNCAKCIFVTYCQRKACGGIGKIRLNSLSVNLTTRCSLNCKYCLALTPRAKERKIVKDLSGRKLKVALEILQEYIDEIKEFSVVGGEPLLNKEICDILEIICNSTIRFSVINILTNGTVPIPDQLMDLLKNQKIKITIDDYGNRLAKKEQDIIKINIENLKKNGCNYAVIDNTNGTWYDYGNFEDRKLSDQEVIRRFAQCVTGECIVLTPECYLGKCGRHMSAVTVFGGIEGDEEYVDLLNDKENVKDRLIKILYAKTLTACNYCNGFGVDNIVSAGEQE